MKATFDQLPQQPPPLHGMAVIPDGTLLMGSNAFYPEEGPVREVTVASFLIDRNLVTNRDFARFISETGYVTVAERSVDPAAYPDLDANRLQPGAAVFAMPKRHSPITDFHDWWRYVPGACWHRPEGRTSIYVGRLDHPVTCVAYEDAAAFAGWAGKRLPTEAEWEWAARGGLVGATYAWGDDWMPAGKSMANTWQGRFPDLDLKPKAGHRTSRVGSYPPNGHGLSDMIGNVWEWTATWYRTEHDSVVGKSCCIPPEDSFDPDQPLIRIPRRVIKGGSFLCAENYCERYRPAARQPQMIDTATVHIGFRCAMDITDKTSKI